MPAMSVFAIVLAAGRGTRMGAGTARKQYLHLDGKPVIAYSLHTLAGVSRIKEIIMVVPPGDETYCAKEIVEQYHLDKVTGVVAGGNSRQESVYNGLRALPCLTDGMADIVLIHDGVRPFVRATEVDKLIDLLIDPSTGVDAAVVGVPVTDTVKVCGTENIIVGSPDRKRLWAAQTPQGFRKDIVTRAHRLAREELVTSTDDAALVAHLGVDVKMVEGRADNIKITTPLDLKIANLIIDADCVPEPCTGSFS